MARRASGTRPVRKSTAKKSRRTQEERRRDTQDKILRAAIDLLVEKGYAGFSTIAVAARAGVSRGAREFHFRTKYDLIRAAWHAALQRAEARSRDKAKKVFNSSGAVDDFIASSHSFFLSKDYTALLELATAARTDRKVERIFHDLYRDNRRSADLVWIDALIRTGYRKDKVERFVALANCLFRGAALMSAWGLPPSLYQPVIAELHALAPTLMGSRPTD
jgi:AcrR family transcriptional regulator